MKIYVINLEKDIEKKNNVISLFQKLNINNYEIINAVDGKKLKDYNIYDKWFDPWSHLHLTQGEVGCALSHIKIWNEFNDSDEPLIMILEDVLVHNIMLIHLFPITSTIHPTHPKYQLEMV